MSLLYADLSAIPVIMCALTVPMSGIWHADVVLDRVIDIAGPQVLTLVGTTWTCTPVRATDFSGRRELRLVGGNGGWRKNVPFKQYASPSGVPLPTIIGDLVAFVQEIPPVLSPLLPPTVGPAYVRQAGLASIVLGHLLGDAWWMDPTGTIQTTPRVPLPITSAFTATEVKGASGRYVIATESPGDWTPSNLFVGPTVSGTVNSVRHVLSEGALRTEIMVTP